ncbi:putative metalloprotease CJM1_0395 family protein [Cognaticolwellia mytili]|uniref:putative metalloprotease CJM1_0395 family protein n=1 Tax=Cognaticolwellia mytili TaxID=1888913 RepID=UPI000A16DE9E|nr:putative metalloprotease CJM1_0395 family protein [Cognaticolwellia mytili]
MNITPQAYTLPIQTAVNLQTDSLRRDNQQREVIAKPEASNQSAGEKGVASDKERGRTPAQNNEQVDFASLRKQAEQASASINGGSSDNESSSQNSQQNASQDPTNENNEQNSNDSDAPEGQVPAGSEQKSDAEVLAETQEIRSLESRDKEVRTHEMAHASVGGAFTGSPSYSFEIGPNGKKYAVEGEVSVDLTPVAGDPKETIAKMKRVQAAALAPASPSAQDTRVAASASSIIVEAQADLITKNSENSESKPEIGNLFRDKEVLAKDDDNFESNESSKAFDHQMQQTLSSQETVAPSRANAVNERAGRIEQFYSTINHAYEKPPSHQFELTA